MPQSFYQKLHAASQKNQSLLCLGLDPDPQTYPEAFPGGTTTAALTQWGVRLIEATTDLVCAYKPNIAFYEQFGPDGFQALRQTLAEVPDDIPVLLDAKRGDIGSTAVAYARAVFEVFQVDAVTLSPYLGRDCIDPFLAYPEKAVFILCYTSNPSAKVLQSFPDPEAPLYLQVAAEAQTWAGPERLGFVVGATRPHALARVRAAAPDRMILAPGVGAQGGDLAGTVTAGLDQDGGGLIVPVSRGILYSEEPRQKAQAFRDQINQIRRTVQSASPEAAPQKFPQTTHPHQDLILGLYDLGCVQFGQFTLASGATSPYYIDLRQIIADPPLFKKVIAAYAGLVRHLDFDRLAGIPYGALPTAAGLTLKLKKPMIYPRKEVKAHGMGRAIEGQFQAGETVVVIEDLITSGGSAIDGAEVLKKAGLQVNDIVVLIDREQDGQEKIKAAGYTPHAVLTLSEIVAVLRQTGRLSQAELKALDQDS